MRWWACVPLDLEPMWLPPPPPPPPSLPLRCVAFFDLDRDPFAFPWFIRCFCASSLVSIALPIAILSVSGSSFVTVTCVTDAFTIAFVIAVVAITAAPPAAAVVADELDMFEFAKLFLLDMDDADDDIVVAVEFSWVFIALVSTLWPPRCCVCTTVVFELVLFIIFPLSLFDRSESRLLILLLLLLLLWLLLLILLLWLIVIVLLLLLRGDFDFGGVNLGNSKSNWDTLMLPLVAKRFVCCGTANAWLTGMGDDDGIRESDLESEDKFDGDGVKLLERGVGVRGGDADSRIAWLRVKYLPLLLLCKMIQTNHLTYQHFGCTLLHCYSSEMG